MIEQGQDLALVANYCMSQTQSKLNLEAGDVKRLRYAQKVSTEFLGANVWTALTAEARRFQGKSFVAVAYLGRGAARRLPLKRGSILVVDASESAVKSGQTSPAELIKFRKRGVRVFNMPNLHAKVFVFGGVAFVGSTNVSDNSDHVFAEASIRSRQASVVSGARQFVRALALNEIGPEKLKSLSLLYDSRKKSAGGGKRRIKRDGQSFYIVRLSEGEEPLEDVKAIEKGVKKAKEMMTSNETHRDMYFWNSSKLASRYKPGDSILPVFCDSKNKVLYIEPPAEFLFSHKTRKKRYWHFEQVRRRDLSVSEFRKRMPAHLKQKINRAGKVHQADELIIRRAFTR